MSVTLKVNQETEKTLQLFECMFESLRDDYQVGHEEMMDLFKVAAATVGSLKRKPTQQPSVEPLPKKPRQVERLFDEESSIDGNNKSVDKSLQALINQRDLAIKQIADKQQRIVL